VGSCLAAVVRRRVDRASVTISSQTEPLADHSNAPRPSPSLFAACVMSSQLPHRCRIRTSFPRPTIIERRPPRVERDDSVTEAPSAAADVLLYSDHGCHRGARTVSPSQSYSINLVSQVTDKLRQLLNTVVRHFVSHDGVVE